MPVRVLIVDDDELSREVLELLLQADGYEVETAESGDEAMLRLQTMSVPEVVLTDLQMPGTTGDALARLLREVCGAGTRLLAMSGSELQEGEGREFDGFLLKPFSVEMLAEALAGGVEAKAAGGAVFEVDALDDGVYGQLAEAMRASRLEELYALCLEDVARRVDAMREMAFRGDDAGYRREAHAIKGGCGMVGACEMQRLATSMEERGLSDDHVASLDELMLARERLRRILIARRAMDSGASEVSGEDAQ
jgi:CheY-like chemotaxis protein